MTVTQDAVPEEGPEVEGMKLLENLENVGREMPLGMVYQELKRYESEKLVLASKLNAGKVESKELCLKSMRKEVYMKALTKMIQKFQKMVVSLETAKEMLLQLNYKSLVRSEHEKLSAWRQEK